jgi:aspartate/methionine/tyrosine aminotransferase
LTGDLLAVQEMREAFDRRRKIMSTMLNAIDGVSCVVPDGAFYCFPDVRGLIGRSLGGVVSKSSTELAEVLLEKIKIAVVPGEAFGTPGFFRLSYALGDDDLVDGLERLTAFVAAG